MAKNGQTDAPCLRVSLAMKIALLHDDFMQEGGAESLFSEIAQIFPSAPVYTSLVDWDKLPESVSRERVITSFIQKIPFASKFNKLLLSLYPLAFESFDFGGFDLVISSTTRFAKSAITKPQTVHISYVNNVPRFLWDEEVRERYLPKFLIKTIKPYFSWLRRWDRVASSRVDFYIANSQNIAERIKRHYGRFSFVIYPCADTDFFTIPKVHNWQLKSKDYFLIVTRLVRWKKVELAIDALAESNSPLIIVGDGPDENRLRRIAKRSSKVQLVGRVTRKRLKEFYQNTRALIVTQEEDFGISMVEAQACGIPVIAYGKGGQKEIVIEAKTGLFFENQSAQSLKDAIKYFSRLKWSKAACRKNALRFSKDNFISNLRAVVKKHAAKTIGV